MDKINKGNINLDENTLNEIENTFDNNKIIKVDIIISAMKKYILRNIKDKDEDNYLFDLNNLIQKDLWDISINTNEFNDDLKNMVKLDKKEKNIIKYLYMIIYNINVGNDNSDGNESNKQEDDEDQFN